MSDPRPKDEPLFDSDQIHDLVEECENLRREATAGEIGDTLPAIHENLLHVRAAMDRTEEIVVTLMKLKSQTASHVKRSRAALDDKWDEEARERKVGFQHSDAAPRERYARYNLSTISETSTWRRMEKWDAQMATALDIARWCHQGLDGIRWTLNNRIRLLTIDTRLET